MASKEPLKKPLNRAEQQKRTGEFIQGIRLYDVDNAISEHMIDTVVPTVESDGVTLMVPVIYGTPERWKSVQRDGALRDKNGKIQTPIIMFKRNSIDRDDSMPLFNRNVSYPSYQKYSQKNKYDRFSLMTGVEPTYDSYNVTMPDYVTLTYEVVIWTNKISHMNELVEAFQYATDEYWGDKEKFKFRVKIDSFDNQQEISETTERIIKTNFTMLVNAYLLPERFNSEPTTEKSMTTKRTVVIVETNSDNLDRKIDSTLYLSGSQIGG